MCFGGFEPEAHFVALMGWQFWGGDGRGLLSRRGTLVGILGSLHLPKNQRNMYASKPKIGPLENGMAREGGSEEGR